MPSVGQGPFQIVANVVGLMPQRSLFCQNALQHSVAMLLYANPTGVFSILGLGLYVPQMWHILAHSWLLEPH